MTTDRERIARVLAKEMGDQFIWEHYLDQADAVLAAIGDRLLPETPRHMSVHEIRHMALTGGESTYCVELLIKGDGWDSGFGYGPTIPAAIRNALENDHD